MTKDRFSNQYWEKAWEADPNTQDKRMKRAGLGNPSAPGFEKWAENFNKNSFTEESQQRTKRIMNWIEQQIGRFSNLSVLDIGAASGVFSVPFAKEGAKVTALEPSPILHDMLKNNANHYDVSLKTLNQSFEDAQLEELGQHELVLRQCVQQ